MENDKVQKCIENFLQVAIELKEYKKELHKQQSYFDTMLSEYYHLFESGKFPAHIQAKLHKKFVEDCLNKRREIKTLNCKIIQMDTLLKNNGLNANVDRQLPNAPFNVAILKEEFNAYKQYLQYPFKIEKNN